MNPATDIDTTQLEMVVRHWWHGDNADLRVVAFRLVESEAVHLRRLYSLLVISRLDAEGAHEAAHLYRHSKKKPWEPAYIEYDRNSNPCDRMPEFINRKRFPKYPTDGELEDFLAATQWELDSSFIILRDTGITQC